nr:PREDICTED: protein LBH [Equus przewalskii]
MALRISFQLSGFPFLRGGLDEEEQDSQVPAQRAVGESKTRFLLQRRLQKPGQEVWAASVLLPSVAETIESDTQRSCNLPEDLQQNQSKAEDFVCPDYLRSAEMTEVMMNTPSMEEIGLNPRKDGLSYQIFPDPSDFDRCCKLKDRLPSIVVEPTEGEVESGELRWPPEEFLVQEDEQDNCEETVKESKEQ